VDLRKLDAKKFLYDYIRGSLTALAALVPRIEYYKSRSGPPSWR